jgi:hypothetical protein
MISQETRLIRVPTLRGNVAYLEQRIADISEVIADLLQGCTHTGFNGELIITPLETDPQLAKCNICRRMLETATGKPV